MEQYESINKLVQTKSGKSIRNGFGELVRTIDERERHATIEGTTIIKPLFQRIDLVKE